MISDVKHIFICLLFVCLHWRNVYSSPLSIFSWIVNFCCCCEFYILYVSWMLPLIRYILANTFCHSIHCFHFVDCFLCCTEFSSLYNLMCLHLLPLPFLLVAYPRNYHQIERHEAFSLCFPLEIL